MPGLRDGYRAFNAALASLYREDLLTLADKKPPFEFDGGVFDKAAQAIYDNKGFDMPMMATPEARAVVEETMRVLETAIGSGLPHEVPGTVRYALENNAFIFSGFKSFHALREVGLSLVTEKGDIKPFTDFLNDVRKINDKYNRNYLYAEYNHAVGASQMAAKWHDIEQDGDRYDLQYRTAGDDKVREEHALLHGITLPPSDPFWESYYPPNGWNCRCTAVQVRRNKYPRSNSEDAIKRGEECTAGAKKAIFRYNPGKSLELFPPKHPYNKAPKEVKNAIDGYVPAEWTPKTVKEAEKFFRDNLGVNCALDGFTSKHIEQIEAIYRSVEEHFQRFPELKKETLFVGSIRGRIKLLTEAKLKEYKKDYPDRDEETLKRWAAEWARKVGSCRNCYAYSHGFAKDMGLSGICFNTSWAGEKIEKSLQSDCKSKWHPPGCGTVKAVIDHELGHEIDRLVGLRSHKDFLSVYNEQVAKGKNDITENLSKYGTTNAAEFIAEAWSEYINNEKPRPIAAAVGMLIKKLYAKKYHSDGSSPPSR